MATAMVGPLPAFAATKDLEMRGVLLHFGKNMWQKGRHVDRFVFNEQVWRRLVGRAVKCGLNTVLIDLGEGLRYPSHPELDVQGAWTPERFRTELARIRALGLEPLPKLNFSCAHNSWLGDYRRMVSSPKYYQVVEDLIHDVAEIFDHPRIFHVGCDEETAWNQRNHDLCVIRQGDLWFHDLNHMIGAVEKNGMRTWMWSDYIWDHPDFATRCPKSVLQSNWYYPRVFDFNDKEMTKQRKCRLLAFNALENAGFDQVPCGSNWRAEENIGRLVKYCRENIVPERLKGFLMATWEMTEPSKEEKILRGMDLFAEGLAKCPVRDDQA